MFIFPANATTLEEFLSGEAAGLGIDVTENNITSYYCDDDTETENVQAQFAMSAFNFSSDVTSKIDPSTINDDIYINDNNQINNPNLHIDEDNGIGDSTPVLIGGEIDSASNNEGEISLFSADNFDVGTFNTVTAPSIANGLNEPKYSTKANLTENISPYSGELALKYNDINLPGRNGLDLNIGRIYQSSEATVGQKTIMSFYEGSPYFRNYLMYDYSNYFNDRYLLGTGWSFNFPSVQIVTDYVKKYISGVVSYDEYKEIYYHTGNGEVYHVNLTSDQNDSNLENYDAKDVQFNENDTSYTNGQVTSYYSLTKADKTKQYFASDGRFLGMKDRFDNTINVTHNMSPITNRIPNGSFRYNGDNPDRELWTFSSPTAFYYDQSFGKGDAYSLKFRNYSSTYTEAKSEYTKVEPIKQYNVGADFYSTYGGDNMQVVVSEYDADQLPAYQRTFNITTGANAWTTLSQNFTTNSQTRYIRVSIIAQGGAKNAWVDNVRLDKLNPIINTITDSIGRTIQFNYSGELKTEAAEGSVVLNITSPNGDKTQTITYGKQSWEFQTQLRGCNDQRIMWYLAICNISGLTNETTYFTYTGDKLPDGTRISLYSNPFSKTQDSSLGAENKPVLNNIITNGRRIRFQFESVRKHMGEDGFYDSLRVINRYESYGYAVTGVDRVQFDGTEYKVTYSYSGTLNGTSFNNETGYPNFYFNKDTALNESYTCEQTGYVDPSDTNNRFKKTSTYSNGKLTTEKIEDLQNNQQTISSYTYDSTFDEFVSTIQKDIIYNGQTNTTYVDITYNDWGGRSSITKPITADIRNNPQTKLKYTTSMTYNPTYKFVETTTYYNDLNKPAVTTENRYDSLGRLYESVNAAGELTSYTYDPVYKGNLKKTEVDDISNMLHVWDKRSVTELTYDQYNAYVQTKLVGSFNVSSNTYDKTSSTSYTYEYIRGQCRTQTNDDEGMTETQYDSAGRLQYAISPYLKSEDGNAYLYTSYQYIPIYIFNNYRNSQNYIFSVVQKKEYIIKNGTTTPYAASYNYYDDTGNLMIKADADFDRPVTGGGYTGVWSYYYYDSYGRIQSIKDANSNITQYKYDPMNNLREYTDARGSKYIYEYNPTQRSVLTYFRPITSTEPEQNHIMSIYDISGNLTEKRGYPDGYGSGYISEHYGYDIAGNRTSYTDAKQQTTQFEYDNMNRMKGITFADNSKLATSYNKFGTPNFEKMYDENNQLTAANGKLIDGMGNLLYNQDTYGGSSPKPVISTYTYDGMGRVWKYTDNASQEFSFDYDEMSHKITAATGENQVSYNYNQYGIKSVISNQTDVSGVTYGYDGMGRMNQKNSVSYKYKPVGVLDYSTDPFSLQSTYLYDSNYRTTNVSAENKNYVYANYDDGLVKSITYPATTQGVLTVNYTYDNLNRLKTIISKVGNTVKNSLSYDYDNDGNVTTETVNSVAKSYEYDELNRINKATYADGKIVDYTYDGNGNRATEIDNRGTNKVYSYTQNRLTSVTNNGVETDSFQYNSIGALTSHNDTEYTYDAWGRLTSFSGNTYKYDAEGTRLANNNTNYITGVNDQVVAETDNTGSVAAQNVYGNNLLARKQQNGWYYYTYNGNGDVIGIIDENGNMVNSYDYDAWGNILSQNETVNNPVKHSGEYMDSNGLYYTADGYYNPQFGLYITVNSNASAVSKQNQNSSQVNNIDIPSPNVQNPLIMSTTSDLINKRAGITLNVPYYSQMSKNTSRYFSEILAGTELCWATSLSMIISYYKGDKRNRNLDIAIELALNKFKSADPIPSDEQNLVDILSAESNWNQGADNDETAMISKSYLVNTRAIAGRFTFGEVIEQLDRGNPVMLSYDIKGSGHVVVIIGYDENFVLLIKNPASNSDSDNPHPVNPDEKNRKWNQAYFNEHATGEIFFIH